MWERRIITGLAAVLVANTALAQPKPKPDGAWRGGIGLSAASASGNTQTTTLGLNGDAVRQTTTDKFGLTLQDIFARSTNAAGERSITAQIFRMRSRYDADMTERLYAFGGLDIEHDKLAGVKRRILPQVGLGLHVIKSETSTFDVFSGVAYNQTTFYTAPKSHETELLIGEESIHKFSASTSLRLRLTMFAPFNDLTDAHRFQFDAGLTTPIIGVWNLVVNYTYRYNNAPPIGIKKGDSLFFTGLQYAWGPK